MFTCVFILTGWQWDPKDRPTFKEIHNILEHMFEKSTISEGKPALSFHAHLHISFLIWSVLTTTKQKIGPHFRLICDV